MHNGAPPNAGPSPPQTTCLTDIDEREFQVAVLAWYDRFGRKDLPWKRDPHPYRIWISEIMLQQTQVVTVIPYFQRFTGRFPTLGTLAEAGEDEVLQYWAGLGYYARARNLHRAARMVVDRHGGKLPIDPQALELLPGIGRSTAGAIASLGFGLRAAILDGNVKRVLSRLAGIRGWPGDARVLSNLWMFSERLTPANRAGEYNQAMMDLGSGICTRRRPECPRCPVSERCVARIQGLTDAIPAPKPRREMPERDRLMVVVRDLMGRVYLERRPPTGIWGGLWSLPEFDDESGLADWCRSRGIAAETLERLSIRRHTFTHFHLNYRPVLVTEELGPRVEESGSARWWFTGSDLALPSPIRQLLDELQ